MKHIFCGLVLIVAVLFAGCTTTAPSTGATTAPATTDLTGKWTGSMAAYINGTGYISSPAGTMTLVVTNQTGRIFNGTMIFTDEKNTETTQFAGAIGHDGKTLTIVNENGGYDTGSIISNNEIELVYVCDAPPYTVSVDSLERAE
ncbi:MAG TPA: hypothetical protein PKM50_04260 [Methanoregula sp.]|nr:hypothetical protein [Methanoregula sp.]